jgi:hypothetical protein
MSCEPAEVRITELSASERWKVLIDDLLRDADLVEWRGSLAAMTLLNRLARELPGIYWASLPGGGGVEINRASSGVEFGLQLEAPSLYVCRPDSLACIGNSKSFDLAYFDLQLTFFCQTMRRPAESFEKSGRA